MVICVLVRHMQSFSIHVHVSLNYHELQYHIAITI